MLIWVGLKNETYPYFLFYVPVALPVFVAVSPVISTGGAQGAGV